MSTPLDYLQSHFYRMQAKTSIWIKNLNSVMAHMDLLLPKSVPHFITVSFRNVIYVLHVICFVPPILFFFILPLLVDEVLYMMHKKVVKWISLATIYWRCVYQPENQDLNGAIDDMSLIMKELVKINDACGSEQYRESQSGLSRRDFRIIGKNVVVKLESELNEIYDRLVGHSSQLEFVSIVGMGGIGKTTLARQVHDHPSIVHHFDVRYWVAVSQEYSLCRVMLDLLDYAKIDTKEILQNHKDDDKLDQRLGEHLYRSLMSRRYLIVMDDMWDTKVWDFVRKFFPDNQNGSRVILTTRLSQVASYVDAGSGSPLLHMQLLNDDDSWHLLREKVFGGEGCPHELETIGRIIAQKCRGLPLAIVLTAGFLYNVDKMKWQWQRVSKSLNSKLYDEQCLGILGLSYNNLPLHLKPCFLYMGAFLGAKEFSATKLFNLLAAEGLLKPSKLKNLKEVAEEYLNDLLQRNMILVGKRSCNGNIKTYKIHDLLRNVCLLNTRKENFLGFANRDVEISYGWDEKRHKICNHFHAVTDRSSIQYGTKAYSLQQFFSGFRLLRVLELLVEESDLYPNELFRLVHLRYLGLTNRRSLSRSISQLLNLQTLVLDLNSSLIPNDIYLLPHLRHVNLTKGWLPEPPDFHLLCDTVLENLQTLEGVSKFRFTKGILERIPNLKKLAISCEAYDFEYMQKNQFESLANLHQLETLKITAVDYSSNFGSFPVERVKLAFSKKLKNLSLCGCKIPWESMTVVGALPELEVLKLKRNACVGGNWEPVEGEFCQLKVLLIDATDLEHWVADDAHFPQLQRLILRWCKKLQEIPCGIGDIPTLEHIELAGCHPSAQASAVQILAEQESMGNEYLKIHIDNAEKIR